MSFSSDVKTELCKNPAEDNDRLTAELYGILLFGKLFSEREIVFTTENPSVSKRAELLLNKLFPRLSGGEKPFVIRKEEHRITKLRIAGENNCSEIFESFGHSKGLVSLRVNRAVISSDENASDFLRGVFLSCGSILDPMKGYHAEFCVPHKNLSMDLCRILTEINECDFQPKTVRRNGSYVVYFKGSEQICDLLTYIGASNRAMEIMGTKAIKLVRNNVNRRINSEVANISKTVSASVRQIEAIESIKKKRGLDSLPSELYDIAVLRLENPEMSLRDLGAALAPPISRSGANHRIKKILEIAEDL